MFAELHIKCVKSLLETSRYLLEETWTRKGTQQERHGCYQYSLGSPAHDALQQKYGPSGPQHFPHLGGAALGIE